MLDDLMWRTVGTLVLVAGLLFVLPYSVSFIAKAMGVRRLWIDRASQIGDALGVMCMAVAAAVALVSLMLFLWKDVQWT